MIMKACQYVITCSLGNGGNAALSAEALVELDLVDAVVQNMKGDEEGKIVTRMDCLKVWELLTSKKFKVSQLLGDGQSTVSRIVEIENKKK